MIDLFIAAIALGFLFSITQGLFLPKVFAVESKAVLHQLFECKSAHWWVILSGRC